MIDEIVAFGDAWSFHDLPSMRTQHNFSKNRKISQKLCKSQAKYVAELQHQKESYFFLWICAQTYICLRF